MKKIKTSEATGAALDWLVAKCEGRDTAQIVKPAYNRIALQKRKSCDLGGGYEYWAPSTNWEQGGPIKEREGIATRLSNGKWYAMLSTDLGDGERAQWCQFTFRGVPKGASTSRRCRFDGPTELIAAMRCYSATKLGAEVEVPEELL